MLRGKLVYCNNCGTQMADGAKFCPKCGIKMEAQKLKMEQREQ